MERAKKNNEKFKFYMLTNGDTFKQLLARIRYFRYKNKSKWPKNQTERAAVLFELYLDIQKDYDLAEAF
jgi:transposase